MDVQIFGKESGLCRAFSLLCRVNQVSISRYVPTNHLGNLSNSRITGRLHSLKQESRLVLMLVQQLVHLLLQSSVTNNF